MLWSGDGLVITQMVVPDYVHLGSDISLHCLYDHEGDPLYSLKWYKGSHGKCGIYLLILGDCVRAS